MELIDLDFEYLIELKRFDYLSYYFNIFANSESTKQIAEIATNSLEELREIMEKVYCSCDRTPTGKIRSEEINFGYDYSLYGLSFLNIGYRIKLNETDSNKRAILKIMNREVREEEKLLALYDAIISKPELAFSAQSRLQMGRIKQLREGHFEIKQYLAIENKQ